MPGDPDDSDDLPIIDWGEQADTTLDGAPLEPSAPVTAPHAGVPPVDTAPHRSIDYLGGRETGYSEGLNAILVDLAAELRKVACLTETDVLVIVGRLREKAERKG